MRLSRPQLDRLRDVQRRTILAEDINRGNERRTYATLFKLGLIDWDPLLMGRVAITLLGVQALAEGDPLGTLRIRDVGDRRVITLTGLHEEELP